MAIRAKHPSAQAGLLKLAALGGVDFPVQCRRLIGACDGDHHEARQVFPSKYFLDSILETAARDATLLAQPLELAQFHLGFDECCGNSALLPQQQLLALDHNQCTVQLADLGSHARGPDLAELARQRLHLAALRRHLQRFLRRLVPQRQRDEAVVAGGIEIELQLRAPESAVSHQRTLGGPQPILAAVQRLVQLRQSPEAAGKQRLVRAVTAIRPVQQRHMPRLADQHAQPDHPQILALALGVSASSKLARRQGGDVGVEVRRVEGQHVGRELEVRHRRLGDGHLSMLQVVIGDLLGDAMKCLPAERRSGQARHPRQTRVEEVTQVAFGSGCTSPLNRHGNSQLAHRRTPLGANVAACPIDEPDQVELFGHPNQCADVAQCARSHGACGSEIGHRCWCSGSQHDLARHGALPLRVPHRLSGDAIAATTNFSFEYVHVCSCSIIEAANKQKPSIHEAQRPGEHPNQ